MRSRASLLVLIGLAVIVAGVLLPPVVEDQLEPGFCSADCPVQHAGHVVAVSPSSRPRPARSPAPTDPTVALAAGATLAALASPDAPRAPPIA